MKRVFAAVGVMVALLVGTGASAQPSTSTVTYQGVLTQSGVPVLDGSYTLTFKIYDAASGGTLVETIAVPGVVTSQGKFTALVPVAPSSFNGADRWWSVTFNGVELPRQKVTATPYAISSHVLGGGRVMVDIATGNVGIGTQSPNSSFGHLPTIHLEGMSPGIKFRDTETTDASGFELFANGGSLTVVSNENGQPALAIGRDSNIGIGTTTPNSSVGHHPTLHIEGVSPGVKFRDIEASDAAGFELYVNGGSLSLLNNRYGTVPFRVSSDDEVFVSVLTITGADVAEKFDIAATATAIKPEPGMVVSIDPNNPGKLVVASTPYDKRVAGAVSGANGLSAAAILGQGNTDPLIDGEHPVAMSGRIYVWCDASGGAIEPGDMLTSSATPGHAMKATDRDQSFGAVIGKAMTRLESGKGLVLVLVNLQ